ncbi:hypothetical protein L1K40_27295, partial [Escherichia coli]|nr:hypothetical protein [Escherichia coli]
KSYGLAVAALAGVPKEVIRRAKQKLKELEMLSGNSGSGHVETSQLMLLTEAEPSEIELALDKIDPDALTPRQALEQLYRLKEMAK